MAKCYICGSIRPKSLVRNLSGKCLHEEKACRKCLRKLYVERPYDALHFPLRCFHPDCQHSPRGTAVEGLCQSREETRGYRKHSTLAGINRAKFGEHWKNIFIDLKKVDICLGPLCCRCPRCNFVILRQGGCNHMTCICGYEFDFREARLCDYLAKRLGGCTVSCKKKLPCLMMDDCGFESDDGDCSYDSYEDEDISVTSSTPSQHFITIEDEDRDIMEDFVIVSYGSGVGGYLGENPSNTGWEELSDNLSIVSLASASTPIPSKSYLEAVTHRGNEANGIHSVPRPRDFLVNVPANNEYRKEHYWNARMCPRHAIEKAKRNCEAKLGKHAAFDSNFEYKSSKYSRGGKEKFMFKHQPRRKYLKTFRMDREKEKNGVHRDPRNIIVKNMCRRIQREHACWGITKL